MSTYNEHFIDGWRSDPLARKAWIADLTRELSKTGSLEAFEDCLLHLAAHLTLSEAVCLYAGLQKSHRPESEWKHEFLDIFSVLRESDLPPPIVNENDARRFAEVAKRRQDFGEPDFGYPEIPF